MGPRFVLFSTLACLGACFDGTIIEPGGGPAGGAGGQGGASTNTGGAGAGVTGGGGEAGAGGAACDPVACAQLSDECNDGTCEGASCVLEPAPAGKVVNTQILGDCLQNECNGAGMVVAVEDASDPPADEECVSYACDAGAVVPTFASVGAPCGAGLSCNGAGVCVGCVVAADCPTPPTCQDVACVAEECMVSPTAAGVVVPGNPTQNCQNTICNGMGSVTTVNDDADVPASDSNPCTSELCSSGTPIHPAKPAGAVTPENGVACNGVCQANAYAGTCGLRIYSRTFPSAGSWSSQAASLVWTGANAPAPTNITAAEETSNSSRMIVVRQTGGTNTYHELVGGTWTTANLNSVENLGTPTIASLITADFGGSGELAVFSNTTAALTAWQYLVPPAGPLDHQATVTIGDPMDVNRCPQHQFPILWAFNEQRTPFPQEPTARTYKYCNGMVYIESNNDFSALSVPTTEAASPLAITGANGSPSPGTIVAAYYRKATNTVFMVAP